MIIKLLKEKLAERLVKKKLEDFIKRTFSWWEKLGLDEKIDFYKIDITNEKKCPKCAYELNHDIIGEINKNPSHKFSFS